MSVELKLTKSPSRLLIISHDVVGTQMAGPGIRFYEFAKVLSNFLEVTLAAPNKVDIETENFRVVKYEIERPESIKRLTDRADIILLQGHILYHFPNLKHFPGKIIIDLYNPFNLESLEMFREKEMIDRIRIDKNNLNIIKLQLTIGDYFICASEKQKDYWLGMLGAMGRLNPYNYDRDDTFSMLITVVPFGIPSEPPVHSEEPVRNVIPSLREDDKIALWGGGIWNWLDPITPIKAMWEITRSRNDLKLIFIGVKHPDPKLPEMRKCIDAIKLSKELDLYEKYVFFNEWTPYKKRQDFLLESSLGLSIHQERIETEFAYRTRVMDYIWAGLPVVSTEGDAISKLVKEKNIGEVVGYKNTQQLARVIESVLTNKSLNEIYKRNLKKIAPDFYWENICRPLVEYCIEPWHSADKKKIFDLIKLQNSKITNLIKSNFRGSTNVLAITANEAKDRELFEEADIGKIFYLETGQDFETRDFDEKVTDKVGLLKSRILSRTKFDGILVNNAFENITAKFFYDLLNVLNLKLKEDGILFFSLAEKRGLANIFKEGEIYGRTESRIDEFTLEYILQNTGYEVIEKGLWDKIEKTPDKKEGNDFPEELKEIYGKNELFELFEIKLSRKELRELSLLKRFNMLETDELKNDKSIKGKIRRYMYLLTSMYFENLRKSYNASVQAINNNIQVQINDEINRLNAKNRERMLLIYFNIFKLLEGKIRELGIDVRSFRELQEKISGASIEQQPNLIDDRLDLLLRDLENIDEVMGLSISHKYYIARKL